MPTKKRIALLHGWGVDVRKLKTLADELKRMGWKVLIPELPGFGISPPKSIWGVGEYADYVLEEAQKVFGKNKFFVFGHSFGGRVAIKLAEKYNEKLSGIVLCSISGLSRGNPLRRAVFFVLAKAGKIFLIIPPVATFWRRLLYKLAKEHDYEEAQGIMKEVFKKVISEDLKPTVERIKVPALVLWGKEDRMTPISDAYYIKKTLPAAKLVVFEGEGHRLPYDRPEVVAEEIEKWVKNLN